MRIKLNGANEHDNLSVIQHTRIYRPRCHMLRVPYSLSFFNRHDNRRSITMEIYVCHRKVKKTQHKVQRTGRD